MKPRRVRCTPLLNEAEGEGRLYVFYRFCPATLVAKKPNRKTPLAAARTRVMNERLSLIGPRSRPDRDMCERDSLKRTEKERKKERKERKRGEEKKACEGSWWDMEDGLISRVVVTLNLADSRTGRPAAVVKRMQKRLLLVA